MSDSSQLEEEEGSTVVMQRRRHYHNPQEEAEDHQIEFKIEDATQKKRLVKRNHQREVPD